MPSPAFSPENALDSRRSRRARLALVAFALCCGVGVPLSPVLAATCLYKKPNGEIHASNLPPEKSWTIISCVDSSTGPAPRSPGSAASAAKTPSPAGFPRVDPETQKTRDDTRRKVLSEELASEEGLLKEARLAYADGAPAPLPEEKVDAEKYRARITRLRQAMTLHQKNIEALKKELAAAK